MNHPELLYAVLAWIVAVSFLGWRALRIEKKDPRP